MVINGRKISQELLDNIKKEVATLPMKPVFCDVLVGRDPTAAQYVNMKALTAERAGFVFRRANFSEDITTSDLVAEIHRLNREPNMCGLIIQLPLPQQVDRQVVLNTIEPKIDVDCLGVVNSQLFYGGQPYVVPPTAAAVMEILSRIGVDYKNQKFLVLGQGQLVGRPVSFLLQQLGANVSVADASTTNAEELLKSADVVISATGQPKLITGDKIKSGAIIIDAGSSEINGGIVGDVDFDSVTDLVSWVSPVPGGVGPVTVAMLLSNVLKAARQ